MSPRRSSRARSSHLPPSTSGQTHSTTSSTSTKPDRSTRSVPNGQTQVASPRTASTVRSESIEDPDSTLRGVNPADLPPRRSRRGNDADIKKEKDTKIQRVEGEDEVIEEDVTRCICGQPEYPGPGASVREQQTVTEPISDEIGNFFVQCDKCHVWQHGGCMGLTDESMLPDEYYCELCKPEYHRVTKSLTGMKSSHYLPVLEGFSTRSTPLSSTDAPRKGSGKNKPLEYTKRRATMNSRGAYDEDEMIRRAIEESKESGPLLGKRVREEGEDQNPVIKRQRTASSVSSIESRHNSQSPQPTTEDSASRLAGNGKISSKLRGAAAKNSREKELREKQKEQIAVQRAEAANKRHARSERRRVDESPPLTPSLSPSKAVQSAVMVTKPKADTPPSLKAQLSRKGGRPPARRGRLGRNQYTRDLPLNGETSDSPLRDIPDDRHGIDSPRPHTNGFKDNINGESGRSSKAKTHPARTSLNEMKRRVAAILEFVGRMQTERGERTQNKSSTGEGGVGSSSSRSSANSLKGNDTPHGKPSQYGLPTANLVKAVTQGLEEANEVKRQVTNASETARTDETAAESNITSLAVPTLAVKSGKEFDVMNSMEMMENITKDLVAWQSLYGTYAR